MAHLEFILLQNSSQDALGTVLMIGIAIFLLAIFSSIPGINIGFRAFGLPPIKERYRAVLNEHSDFYKMLPPKEKKLFEGRVQHFINIKDFIPRSIDGVTAQMKALIAASAIQITFGLPKVYLSHFKRILIYPDNYYSTINKVYHKGEVNPLAKLIVLSWRSFVEGYLDRTDGINLGLHEMAHALRLENLIMNDEYQFFNESDLDLWSFFAKKEIVAMRRGEVSMFREYGAANEEEFFAVVIENFFERTRMFSDYCPDLYQATVKLLNQNPLEYIRR